MSAHYDLIVVGAGICGAVAADVASAAGLRVAVVEKEHAAAQEGSGRAQGILRLQGRAPEEHPLAVEALRLWHELPRPEAIELTFGGNLYLALQPAEVDPLRALVADAGRLGVPGVELLTAAQVRELVPAARGRFTGAMWSPSDGHCQPDKASAWFLDAAVRRGAEVHFDTKALAVTSAAGEVTGVRTTRGPLQAPAVVVACGVWTPHLLATAGVQVPVLPVALSELETTAVPPLFSAAVRAYGFGARQRPDGRLVVSNGLNAVVDHRVSLYDLRFARLWSRRLAAHWRSVRLRAGVAETVGQLRHRSTCAPDLVPAHRGGPTARRRRLAAALRAMAAVFPDVAAAHPARAWAGLVDMSPDGLPIVDSPLPGLSFATGLSGHGFTLGPVLGRVLVELATEGHTTRQTAPFRLARFDGQVPVPTKTI